MDGGLCPGPSGCGVQLDPGRGAIPLRRDQRELGLLEGLAADPPDDTLMEGKVAYLTPAARAKEAGPGRKP